MTSEFWLLIITRIYESLQVVLLILKYSILREVIGALSSLLPSCKIALGGPGGI